MGWLRNRFTSEVILEDKDKTKTQLALEKFQKEGKLSDCCLLEVDFSRMAFRNTSFKGCSFKDANLEGVVFENVECAGCNFSGAKMQGARLINCNMQDAGFANTDLTEAILENVNMKGAYLKSTNFTRARLKDITWDEKTYFYRTKLSMERLNMRRDTIEKRYGEITFLDS